MALGLQAGDIVPAECKHGNHIFTKIKVQTNDKATSSNHHTKASGETMLGSLTIFLVSDSWRHETTAARMKIRPNEIQSCKSFNPVNPDSDKR